MKKPRTYYQQIADAVKYEKKLNATLIKVTREHNKSNFTFKHSKTGETWRTTLSKLENYNHNKFNNATKGKAVHNYWAPNEWEAAGRKSPHFESFKVYIIRCTNKKTKESFYKIGRTYKSVDARFSSDFPYSFTIERVYTGTAVEVCNLEKHLHNMNKENQYWPKVKFSGMSECFTSVLTHDGRSFFDGLHLFGLPKKDVNDYIK